MPRKKAEKKTPNATHKAVDEVMCAKTNTQTDENMAIISLPISNQIIEKIIKDDMECNLDMPLAYDPVGELSHYEINEVHNEQIRSCCFGVVMIFQTFHIVCHVHIIKILKYTALMVIFVLWNVFQHIIFL